jgi:hypothetical protein
VHATALIVEGYRGFRSAENLKLAIPNGNPGSGLTILVGPNSGGKSSVIEALQLCSDLGQQAQLSRGKRNVGSPAGVRLSIEYSDNSKGFKKIVGILDSNAERESADLQARYTEYLFRCIPAPDVRTKPSRSKPAENVEGLLGEDHSTVRSNYRESAISLFNEVNDFLAKH